MLDRQKVRLMAQLAFYEQTQGKNDFKVNEYYRKDYAGLHILCSVIWITIGYVCLVGLTVIAHLDMILENISKSMIFTWGIVIALGYVLLQLFYMLITKYIYDHRHRSARQRLKKYNHNLTRLLKMYEKEK